MPETISVQELTQQLSSANPPQVIDIRDQDQYAAGHIPGALNIPKLRLEYRPGFVENDQPLVLYGNDAEPDRSGAEEAARILAEHNVQASILNGGLQAWIHAGHPVEYEQQSSR